MHGVSMQFKGSLVDSLFFKVLKSPRSVLQDGGQVLEV